MILLLICALSRKIPCDALIMKFQRYNVKSIHRPLQWWQWDHPSCIGKFKMLQFNCNTCHIVSLIVRNKKVNYMISIRCCVIEIKDSWIRKGHWPFVGGKFSRWSDFNGYRLKLIGLPHRLKNIQFVMRKVLGKRGNESSKVKPIWHS